MIRDRLPRWAPALLSAAFALTAFEAAAAPTKDQCIDADTKAQSLRRAGHLAAAREQLRTCVAQACPGLVRDDCSQRLDELERVQPTIVFEAQDSAGHDVAAVTVRIDGQHWLDRLDGAAAAVDPGPHSFQFEAVGQVTVVQQFVIREGEKGRRERVVFGAASSTATAPAAPTESPPWQAGPLEATPPSAPVPPPSTASAPPSASVPESAAPPGRTQRTLGFVAGGVGIVGLVVGTISGAVAMSSWNSAKSLCGTTCQLATRATAEDDKNAASSAATVSTVAFLAGGALLAGGVALVLTAPSASSASLRGLGIAPIFLARGGGAGLIGGF